MQDYVVYIISHWRWKGKT